jgi:hypothetical protein
MEATYTAPYNFAQGITTSNTVNFTPVSGRACCDAINIGGAGAVAVVLENDQVVTLTCSAGQVMPIKAKRVNATGTAATGLVALYVV